MACSSITSWQIEGGKVKAVTDFLFLGSKMTTDSDCSHEIKRCLVLGRKAVTNLVQFSSVTPSCPTLCDPMNRSTSGLPVCHQLPEFTQTHVHWVSDAIQPSHPLSSPSPPAFNLSQHEGLFQWVNSLHQVAKVLDFNFSISPSKEHPGLISFRMDWLDLLAVQGTLKSLLQWVRLFIWLFFLFLEVSLYCCEPSP